MSDQEQQSVPSKLNYLLEGAKDSTPLIIGAIPFGIIFGTVGIANGLSPAGVMLMSMLVFAGSAQFVSLGLIAVGATIPIILFTTFVVNFRHILYGASIATILNRISRFRKTLLAFLLTDECFAVISTKAQSYPPSAEIDQDYLSIYGIGSGLSIYVAWVSATVAGVLLGGSIPNLDKWGLDFAMPVTFLGMVIVGIRNWPTAIAGVSAALAAVLLYPLPNKIGLVIAVLIGVVCGLAVEHFGYRMNRMGVVHE